MSNFFKHCDCCNGTGYVVDPVKMGDQLKTERKTAKLSAAEIANLLGVCQQELSRIERGERSLSFERVGDYRRAIVQLLISPRST